MWRQQIKHQATVGCSFCERCESKSSHFRLVRSNISLLLVRFILTSGFFIILYLGFGLLTCAVIINSHLFYSYIFDKLGDYYDGKTQFLPIDVITVALYFLGACIGSIACGLYPFTYPARKTNYSIGSVVVIACALTFWINDIAYCIVQVLAGFSYGFIYIVLATHIADNAMKTVRGYMTASFSVSTTTGMIIGLAFSINSWTITPSLRTILNIILWSFPICSLLVTKFYVYEAVTRLLKLDLETEARHVLNESRKGLMDASVIHHEIDEKKLMLREDYGEKDLRCGFQQVFSNRNALPILSMIILRMLHVLTSNVYLYVLSAVSIYSSLNFIVHTILLITRLMVLFIPKYSIDKLGRRTLLLVSGIGSGILLIPFAIHHLEYINVPGNLLGIITFSIHIFATLGIEPVQHIYASEAFPLSKRNASLAIVTCCEYIMQGAIAILFLLGEKLTLQIILIGSPFAVLLLTIISFVKLPETKSMALRRCRDEFNKHATSDVPPRVYVSSIQTLGSSYM